MVRKTAEKRPTIEGPSQKRKFTDPLGMGVPLIIDDEESSWKQHRVMTGLTDDKGDEEDEIPLAHWYRAQSAPCAPTPTPPQAATPPRATTPPRVATPPKAPTLPQVATPA
jgi:hypothetical protein